MAQTTISIRMDDNLKKQAEWFCNEFGMSLSTAVTIFAKTMVRERRIPFEITTDADPFYGGANARHIEKGIRAFESGKPGIVKTIEALEDE